MSKARYKVYSQVDFHLDKSWELIKHYLNSEKIGHSEESARSILNEFQGVVLFNHQNENVQMYYISLGEQEGRIPESYFNFGKPRDLQECDFAPIKLHELIRAGILTYIEYLNNKIGKDQSTIKQSH